jgi:hypothetical protein
VQVVVGIYNKEASYDVDPEDDKAVVVSFPHYKSQKSFESTGLVDTRARGHNPDRWPWQETWAAGKPEFKGRSHSPAEYTSDSLNLEKLASLVGNKDLGIEMKSIGGEEEPLSSVPEEPAAVATGQDTVGAVAEESKALGAKAAAPPPAPPASEAAPEAVLPDLTQEAAPPVSSPEAAAPAPEEAPVLPTPPPPLQETAPASPPPTEASSAPMSDAATSQQSLIDSPQESSTVPPVDMAPQMGGPAAGVCSLPLVLWPWY